MKLINQIDPEEKSHLEGKRLDCVYSVVVQSDLFQVLQPFEGLEIHTFECMKIHIFEFLKMHIIKCSNIHKFDLLENTVWQILSVSAGFSYPRRK